MRRAPSRGRQRDRVTSSFPTHRPRPSRRAARVGPSVRAPPAPGAAPAGVRRAQKEKSAMSQLSETTRHRASVVAAFAVPLAFLVWTFWPALVQVVKEWRTREEYQ